MAKAHSDSYISLWRRGFVLADRGTEKTAVSALGAALSASPALAAWLTLKFLPNARLPHRYERDGSFRLDEGRTSEDKSVSNDGVIDELEAVVSGATQTQPRVLLELWVLDSEKANPYADMGGPGVGRVDLSIAWQFGAANVHLLIEAKVAASIGKKVISGYGNIGEQTLDQPLAYALLWDLNDPEHEAELRVVGTLGTGVDYGSKWPQIWHATWFAHSEARRAARVAVADDVRWDDVASRMRNDSNPGVQALAQLLPLRQTSR